MQSCWSFDQRIEYSGRQWIAPSVDHENQFWSPSKRGNGKNTTVVCPTSLPWLHVERLLHRKDFLLTLIVDCTTDIVDGVNQYDDLPSWPRVHHPSSDVLFIALITCSIVYGIALWRYIPRDTAIVTLRRII
jgi:hypothetical protein